MYVTERQKMTYFGFDRHCEVREVLTRIEQIGRNSGLLRNEVIKISYLKIKNFVKIFVNK